MPISDITAAPQGTGRGSAQESRDPLSGRLGLSVPHEWWPAAPLLKSYEAAGCSWVQLDAPPLSVLTNRRTCIEHAAAVWESVASTGLTTVIHAPGGLRAGSAAGDHAFGCLLSYAAEAGATQVVYHALALPEGHESEAAAEAGSLAGLVRLAERLEVTIAIENLAPLYPGPDGLSAIPMNLRGLARRIGSYRLALCLDVGHAHVIADQRHTSIERLCEPVLDLVSLFHVHDNLGARRRRSGAELGVDPQRLDLHLPPGRGTLDWSRLAPLLAGHRAPLLLEVHPPHRPRASELVAGTVALLSPRPGRPYR